MLPGVIGRYRIEHEIGVGGMGVVYKAFDSELNRAVAIKALNERHAISREGVARLRTEAQAAASLDHPFICKVYEFIDADGLALLVMEYVEGDTLEQRLRNGPLSLTDTLRFGREIAEGLADAHAHGLVHRDIKPSNVMVTSHGHVKLLDFGLARPDALRDGNATTRAGTGRLSGLSGTPMYMAPEQAKGQPVTARVDVFAFGVLLFQCLSGQSPFDGADANQDLRKIAARSPENARALPAGTPPDLARLIMQCLAKQPNLRPASAAVLAEELRRLEKAEATRAGRDAGEQARRSAQRRSIVIGSVLTVVVISLLVLMVRSQLAPRPHEVERERAIVSWPSEELESRLSPDGRWVSFLSNREGAPRLFLQSTEGGEPRRLDNCTGDIQSHAWSPDNLSVACAVRIENRLFLQIAPALTDGAPTSSLAIEPAARDVAVRRWIGTVVYFEVRDKTPNMLFAADVATGAVTEVTRAWPKPGKMRRFDVRPDGRQVVFSEAAGTGASVHEDLWIADLDGANRVQLTNDGFSNRAPLWLGESDAVIYQSNRGGPLSLWEISTKSLKSWPFPGQATAEPESSSTDGAFVTFKQTSLRSDLWRLDTNGKTRPLTESGVSDFSPSVSADGRTIAFARGDAERVFAATLMTSTLSDQSVAALDATSRGAGVAGRVSPDGLSLAYLEVIPAAREWRLHVKQLATSENLQVSAHVAAPGYFTYPKAFPFEWATRDFAWSADSAELFFVEGDKPQALRRFRHGTGVDPAPLASAGRITELYVSADGRRLAYLASTNGRPALHVRDLVSGIDQVIASGAQVDGSLLGWTRGDATLILAQDDRVGPNGSTSVRLLEIAPTGHIATVGLMERAYRSTARLDAARSLVYVTGLDDAARNVYSVSLTTGASRAITDNRSVAVGFSRVAPLADGSIIAVREERTRDVWLAKLKR